MILPDLLKKDLNIIFCGTAAGNKSAERKTYYAAESNVFYRTLFLCGLTPHLLKPEEFPSLLDYYIGLTDLAKYVHGMDKDLKEGDFDVKGFEEKILMYQPKVVCFNGKEAAKVYFGKKKTSEINYGLQDKSINKTKLFCAPSTSVKAFPYWDESIWLNLVNFLK